jgi:hypothetical protein
VACRPSASQTTRGLHPTAALCGFRALPPARHQPMVPSDSIKVHIECRYLHDLLSPSGESIPAPYRPPSRFANACPVEDVVARRIWPEASEGSHGQVDVVVVLPCVRYLQQVRLHHTQGYSERNCLYGLVNDGTDITRSYMCQK